MKYAISFILIFFSLSSFYSCAGNSEKPNNKTSVQNQSVLTIKRFDKDFHHYLSNPDDAQFNSLKEMYPHFLKAFAVVTVNMQDDELNSPELFQQKMQSYFENPALSKIYNDALSTFSDLSSYEAELNNANELIKSNFSKKELPALFVHISGFKTNIIVLDSIVSISLDKYLGRDYPDYKQFFESYQIQQMQPQYIVRDYLKAWLMSEYTQSNQRKDLLSEMLYQGKILYALEILLPQWNEADILGYTEDQQRWSKDHAKEIWKTTIDKNYLFNNDFLIIQKYLDEAPYTATISPDSPGRLGAWLGLHIIKEYAKNTGADLQSILSENNNQQILKTAKYNP